MLGSSAERRLQAFRRELTLDLFTRHGPFWEDVRWVRSLRGVDAETVKPPELDPGKVHLPPDLRTNDWARSDRPMALPVTDRAGVSLPLEVWLGNWSRRPERQEALAEWMVLLQVLHDRVVPTEQRVETPNASSLEFWMGFLSACVLYDPPPDRLLDFADQAVAAYGDFVNPLNPWADEDDDPRMLAPPIRFPPAGREQ